MGLPGLQSAHARYNVAVRGQVAKLWELGQVGTRRLPHGSPEIKLGLQVWQQAPSYPWNHLVGSAGFFFFNTNNDIIVRRQKFRYNFQSPL